MLALRVSALRRYSLTSRSPALASWTSNAELRAFVEKTAALLAPARVHLCDSSAEEHARLLREMELTGAMVRAGPDFPGCWIARSTPSDVARVEGRTFICSATQEGAGVLNNWVEPGKMKAQLNKLLAGAAKGRTLYFLPCVGPPPARARAAAPACRRPHRETRRLSSRAGPALSSARTHVPIFIPPVLRFASRSRCAAS